MDEGESLELVEFDSTVESNKTWEASEVINTFLAMYFTKVIDERDIFNIMADFPKPNFPALHTPMLDDEIKR